MVVGIKAGRGRHRVLPVWAVVVSHRVFIRSWSLKPTGWHFVFRRYRVGSLHVGNRAIPIRPVFIRSERLKSAVSRAYAEKYHTPGSRRFVKDLSGKKSRDTTTELVPQR
ncbi:MAG: hypothetical protein HBSIN02_01430 [Bacteroidia bacterium]|nr:MAG: hypothetical protein HBSIN02_01430 [Bacteroidia bacterium]